MRGEASATPSRGRSGAAPPASASVRRRRASSAGSARIRPPSRRIVFRPSSRPAASTSGPPEEPRGSGAVCSIEPPMRRPPGPRKERPVAETRPKVVRRPRPPGLARANTGVPTETPGGGIVLPGDRRGLAGVDGDRGDVEVGVGARDLPVGGVTAGEADRDLLAAQDVRVGQDAARCDDDAGARAPTRDRGRPRTGRRARRPRRPPAEALPIPTRRSPQSHLQLASHYGTRHRG